MHQSKSISLTVDSAQAMRELGYRFGEHLPRAGAGAFTVAIEGELGAGKTTFVGGVLAAAGIAGPVRSPTYTLVEPYEAAGRHLYHLDLYRLADPEEVDALGVRDLLTQSSVLLIEWPSRAEERLPHADVRIDMTYSPLPEPGRAVQFTSGSAMGAKLLKPFLAVNPE